MIGYLEVLNGTTNQAIIDFYHERYVPNNQVFVVVGDVKTQEVLDRVARQWTGTPRGRETYVPLADEPAQLSPREAVREMEGTTYDTVLAWPTVKLSDPDMYALDLAAYILGEGESSRLVRRLKYDRQLVQSIDAASYDAALRPRLFRRLGQLPAGEVAAGLGGHPRGSLPPARRTGRRRPSWPRPRSRRPSSGSSIARPCSRRPKAWAAASSPPPIRCSTRPTPRTSRR